MVPTTTVEEQAEAIAFQGELASMSDEEIAAALAARMDADAETEAVPAGDPVPDPTLPTPTAVLFANHVKFLYDAFIDITGYGKSIKAPNSTKALEEAVKAAAITVQINLQRGI